jgi:hypothetical protein
MSGRFSGMIRALALLALAYVVTSILMAGRKELHANRESLVFHEPGCRFYAAKNCTEVFSTKRAALAAGFAPARCCAG